MLLCGQLPTRSTGEVTSAPTLTHEIRGQRWDEAKNCSGDMILPAVHRGITDGSFGPAILLAQLLVG